MKNIIIIGIMAASTMLIGCGKKAAHENPQQAQNDSILMGMKQVASTSKAVVAYAVADTSKSTNMVFTITEIWKGLQEGAGVGITNGMEIPYQYPSTSTAYLPDAAIVTFSQDSGPSAATPNGRGLPPVVLSPEDSSPSERHGLKDERGMIFVRQGKVCGMTVQEFKTKIGL